MTLAITSRIQSGATASTASKVTSSFTPSASSKLYVYGFVETLIATNPALSISDSVGLSWTLKRSDGPVGTFRATQYLWEADIGGSPAAMTVTLTLSGPASADIAMAVFDVTGNSPQIKSGQVIGAIAATPATVTTGTLPTAATSGNLVVIAEGANRDSFTAVGTPAGFTVLPTRPSGGSQYELVGISYSTAFTGTSTSHSNSPDNEDAGTILLEIEEAAPVDVGYGYVLQESGGNDRITLEDDTGFLLLDTAEADPIPPELVITPW